MNIFPDTETLILYFSAILEKGRVLSVPKYLAEGLCIWNGLCAPEANCHEIWGPKGKMNEIFFLKQ